MSSPTSLTKIIAPPESPVETTTSGDWHSIEAEIGIKIPEDYKELVNTFGTGAINAFLWILNPVSKNPNLNLITQAKIRLNVQRKFSEEAGVKCPYPLHPDNDGLFPWAITDNGDVVYWYRKEDTQKWSIVICDGRGTRWQEFSLTVSEFLAKLVCRELTIDIFPSDFPSGFPEFVPVD